MSVHMFNMQTNSMHFYYNWDCGSALKLSVKFNFGSYTSSVTSTLHETEIEHYYLPQSYLFYINWYVKIYAYYL
jgi:hypothetical protein